MELANICLSYELQEAAPTVVHNSDWCQSPWICVGKTNYIKINGLFVLKSLHGCTLYIDKNSRALSRISGWVYLHRMYLKWKKTYFSHHRVCDQWHHEQQMYLTYHKKELLRRNNSTPSREGRVDENAHDLTLIKSSQDSESWPKCISLTTRGVT